MQQMQQIFDSFKEDLIEIRKTVELLKNMEDFAKEPNESFLNSQEKYVKKANQVSERIKQNRKGSTWIPSILMLYIAGRFENYVRTIFEETSTEVAKKHNQFKDLPKNFQKNLINDTSKVIKDHRKYNHGEGARDSFIKNLYDNVHNNNLNQINYQCISITERNMKPEILLELFLKIDYKKIWDDISSQANIRRLFNGADTDKTKKDCHDKLKEFMDMRNQVAHPSSSITWISKEKGCEYIDFFIVLGEAIKDVCPLHIMKYDAIPNHL